MHPKETVLGFDAREMWSDSALSWPTERRSTYLLRADVVRPLSTDRMVWASLLSVEEMATLAFWDRAVNLATRVNSLRVYLTGRADGLEYPFWILGLTLETGTLGVEGRKTWDARLSASVPVSLRESWRLLGYDVSDLALLSGLSNCGYTAEDLLPLRRLWGRHLNRYHLFEDVERAVEFRDMTDRRVPEHAPFFVYGLYLVEQVLTPEGATRTMER